MRSPQFIFSIFCFEYCSLLCAICLLPLAILATKLGREGLWPSRQTLWDLCGCYEIDLVKTVQAIRCQDGRRWQSLVSNLSALRVSMQCEMQYQSIASPYLNGRLGMELECTMDEQDTEWCLPWQVLLSSQSHAVSGRGCARCRIRVSQGANRWVFLKFPYLWQRNWIGNWKMIINGWHSYDIMIAISKYAKILRKRLEKWSLWRMISYTKLANFMVFRCLLEGGFLWRRCSSSCSPNSHGNSHCRWEPRGWSSGSECQVPSMSAMICTKNIVFFSFCSYIFGGLKRRLNASYARFFLRCTPLKVIWRKVSGDSSAQKKSLEISGFLEENCWLFVGKFWRSRLLFFWG